MIGTISSGVYEIGSTRARHEVARAKRAPIITSP
jgi:hypothetical protein